MYKSMGLNFTVEINQATKNLDKLSLKFKETTTKAKRHMGGYKKRLTLSTK